MEFTIKTPNDSFDKKWQDQTFTFTPATMHDSWKAKIFEYGLRVVNDAMNSAGFDLPSDKVDYIRDMVRDINAGEAWEGRSRGGTAGLSGVDRVALALAKGDLKRALAKLTGCRIVKDMCAASDVAAKYFDGVVWREDVVAEWRAKQMKDYAALAQAKIDEDKALAESLDISDL